MYERKEKRNERGVKRSTERDKWGRERERLGKSERGREGDEAEVENKN